MIETLICDAVAPMLARWLYRRGVWHAHNIAGASIVHVAERSLRRRPL